MATKYLALLTNIGAAKLAKATALGTKVEITQLAVGDGNGVLPTPNPAQTALVHEQRRAPLNMLTVDPANASQIIAEQVLPEDVGGWWIREIGLFDKDGDMVAIANCAETYKPQLQEGSGRVQVIRVILIVSSTEAVTLKIDPAVVLATRQYVDSQLRAHEQSRNHPDASTTEKGFVQLSSSVTSDSESQAATPKAVKITMDNGSARLAKDRNLSDLPNTALARQNLELGDSSTRNVGTTAGTVASGDDARITGAMQKNQNGADIPDVAKFLQNLGLVETINRAAGALQKDQNGADVPQPDWFVRNIGAARAFSGAVNIGGNGNWTTAEFIVWLENQGAFNHPYWMCKGSWSYGNNRYITDTGCGIIQLAGAVVEVLGVRGAMTIRVTTATASTGGVTSAQFTYTNHGDDYWPGWRRDLKRSGDTMLGELKIHGANALRIFDEQRGLIFRRSEESLHLIPTLENQGENGDIGPLRPLSINLRTGEVMMEHKLLASGGAQISSSLGIGVDNVLGENSIVLGDADTGLKQNGDGVLDSYSNGRQVMRIVPDAVQVFGWTGSWIDLRRQPCFTNVTPVDNDGASAIVRQEHHDRHFIIGGLGNNQFGIYMINKSRTANGSDGQAFMNTDADWVCGNRVLPGNYENFDARYQPKDNYATQAWVSQNFVQNIRQSGVAYIDAEKNSGQRLVPAGGV
ncbi:phage tail protein, partial [Citrobacter freundii]